MAGLILTIGVNDTGKHKNLRATFLKNKYVETSLEKKGTNYRLTKFKRLKRDEYNILEGEDISIYCVGNIACKNCMGKDALKSIKEALRINTLYDVLAILDGHFVLLIFNHKEERFSIITDHLGIIHLYKYFDGRNYYLSTSSLVLSRNLTVNYEADSTVQFLRAKSLSDYDTIYSEIKLLEAGCIYNYEIINDNVNETKKYYWKSPTTIEENMDVEEAADLWINALIGACKKIPKESVICDLTGGYDTRSILATMLKFEKREIDDFSTFIFGPNYSSEVQIAKKISSNMQIPIMQTQLPNDWENKYYEYIKDSVLITDGEENACKYAPIMFANNEKSLNYDYSINGLGGPIVKSFNWIQEFDIRKKPANINRFINMRVLKSEFNYDIFQKSWREKILDINTPLKKKYLNIISDMDPHTTFNTLQLDNIDFRQIERRWGGRTISSSNRIINVISPLYFKNCIEAGMVIPPQFKKSYRLLRKVISRLNPLLAGQKMLNGTPCEDMTIYNFYKFYPFINTFIKKAIKVGFKKVFKKNLFVSHSISYKRHQWYDKVFSKNEKYDMFDIGNWSTRHLYVHDKLKDFIDSAGAPGFKYYTQLEKMITLELRIREDKVKDFS